MKIMKLLNTVKHGQSMTNVKTEQLTTLQDLNLKKKIKNKCTKLHLTLIHTVFAEAN